MATSNRRQLPAHSARASAHINIGYAYEEDDDFPMKIAPDDVAVATEEQDEDEEINTGSDSLSSDDDEELDASILEVISGEGFSDEEEEDVQPATPGLKASSGLQWILQTVSIAWLEQSVATGWVFLQLLSQFKKGQRRTPGITWLVTRCSAPTGTKQKLQFFCSPPSIPMDDTLQGKSQQLWPATMQ